MIRPLLALSALIAIPALCAPALAQNPLGRKGSSPLASSSDPLAGEWAGDGLVVVFEARPAGKGKGARYEGSIHLGQVQLPMECTRQGTKELEGSFRSDGERYAFVGRLEGDRLTLESEDSTYRLQSKRESPRNPLAGAPGATAATSPDKAPAAPPKMKDYTHPHGFKFQHPDGWQVDGGEAGITVLAPDVERDAGGQPLEMFIIGGEEAEGVERPDQPEVLAWFDDQIRQMFPKMKRSGEPRALASLLGPGAVLRYTGQTPTGIDGHADVYVTLHRGLGIFMLHLGREDLVEAHAAEAGRMFSSFGWTRGKVDPNLVGLWHRNETSSSSSIGLEGGMDMVGSSSNLYWDFRQDGAVSYSSGTRIFGDVGNISLYDGGGNPNEWRGTWSVMGDTVTIQWDGGGVEQYAYSVFAHVDNQTALKLTLSGEEKGSFFIRQ